MFSLELFINIEKGTYNYKVSFPNVWKLLRLVMINPATTATCERSFSLNTLIKSDTWSTMTDQRMNHLVVLKYYPEDLMDIDIDDVMSDFIARNDISFKTVWLYKEGLAACDANLFM